MKITTDGGTQWKPATSKTAILVSGVFGPATVSVGYLDEDDDYVVLEGLEALEAGKQYTVDNGLSLTFAFFTQFSDGTTDINVKFSPISS